jgi:cysteine desulfurase
MRRVYLDWAAAAPVSRAAVRAYQRASLAYGNPSSPHAEGREARAILEDARTRIARLAGVKADGVLFTSGATEANALAIIGFVRALWDAGRDPSSLHVLYLPSAHASTRGCMDELRSWGVSVEEIALSGGSIDLAAFAAQLREETVLVAMEAVCGETGTRFDTRGVRRALDASGRRMHLHVDAAQLPFAEPFERMRLAADTLALDAQKVGGMRGIGCLVAPRQVRLAPVMRGGGQERGLRPGTETHALAAAFAAALEEVHANRERFVPRASAMRERLLARIAVDIENVEENGGKETVPHILNVSLPGRDTDFLAALLDQAGFAVSTRSACATDEEGSRAVLALTGDPVRAGSTLRISWGPGTSSEDLERFADALVKSVRFLDRQSINLAI